jgi:hypothetical protein
MISVPSGILFLMDSSNLHGIQGPEEMYLLGIPNYGIISFSIIFSTSSQGISFQLIVDSPSGTFA